jgi:hypothetical protein
MPLLLQVFRDFVKPGREAEFRAIEEDAARACAEFGFPHAHIAMQSLARPTEVWWLNLFESEEDRANVLRAFNDRPAIVAALDAISKRREPIIDAPIDMLATARNAYPLEIGRARFYAALATQERTPMRGAAFEASDGTRFVFHPAATNEDAETVARQYGATAFAVRPYWGMAAPEWIAADPDFWAPNPMAHR